METQTVSNGDWHLDKRVPISLIMAIIIQTATFVWLISAMDTRLNSNIARTERLEQQTIARLTAQEMRIDQNATGVAVINENLKYMRESLERIERALDAGK